MFFIQTKFNNKSTDCEDLFDLIDEKVNQISTLLLHNYQYGFDKKINYNSIEDLLTYKAILKMKLDCDNCLCEYSLPLIKSKIRNLTNSIC